MLVESSDRFLTRNIDRVEGCAATALRNGFYDLQGLLSDVRPHVWCNMRPTLLPLSWFLPVTMTVQPFLARCSAVSLPMPVVAPVIRQVLSVAMMYVRG
jgi:hypothetical protein